MSVNQELLFTRLTNLGEFFLITLKIVSFAKPGQSPEFLFKLIIDWLTILHWEFNARFFSELSDSGYFGKNEPIICLVASNPMLL